MTLLKKMILMLSFLLLISGCVSPEENPDPNDDDIEEPVLLNEGELAVNFEFLDYDGNAVTLSDLRGEKVYLKFTASWCSICNRGMPELDDLFAKERDFVAYVVVTPNANGEKSIEDYKAWFDSTKYPNIVILFDVNAKFSKRLGAIAMPTSVFIGSDGVLIQSKPGHTTNSEVEAFIQSFK